jgi:putative transposase
MTLGLLDEAIASGARQSEACKLLGLDARTVQRWRVQDIGDDRRSGPKRPPKHKLSEAERQHILKVINSPEFCSLPATQIVPILAERGTYLASESTIYRLLREHGQLAHRAASRAPKARPRPDELVATAPNQVWSWDITYLPSPLRGAFHYLYMVMDVFSRKIVGWAVHDEENSLHAAALISGACLAEGIDGSPLVLHSDNGGPMKGATMLATLKALGVSHSFSRPRVSNDNPFSEALFRTTKYRPEYPDRPFASVDAARNWCTWFVRWYNHEHRHSGIRYVTPDQRHTGTELALLEQRERTYQQAWIRYPQRWSGKVRNWSRVDVVRLNPAPAQSTSEVM